MRSSRRPAALPIVLFVFLLMPGASRVASAADALAEAYERGVTLHEQRAYARAKQEVEAALRAEGVDPKSPEAQKARDLVTRIDDALENWHQESLAARTQAKKDAARRAARMERRQKEQQELLDRAARLVKEAHEGEPDKYMEAARLRMRVATQRATDAFDRAIEFYEQAEYEKAQIVFQRLQQWVEKQESLDAALRPDIGAAREKDIARYLAGLEDAGLNQGEGAKVSQARAKRKRTRAEAEQKYRETLKRYKAAVAAFKRGQFQEARQGFRQVRASGVNLGKGRQADLARYLKRVETQLEEAEAMRSQALEYMATGEKMLQSGDWKGAAEFLHKTREDMDILSDKERIRLAGLLKQARKMEWEAGAVAAAAADKAADERKRTDEYLQEAARLAKVLRDQEQATADQWVAIAKADYRNLKYNKALEDVEEALKHVPNHPEAMKLRAEIRQLLGLKLAEPVPPVMGIVSAAQRVRLEQARSEMDLAIRRGRLAFEAGKHDEAVKQFTLAAETLEYLRPHYDVRSVETQLRKLLKDAGEAQVGAAEALERRKKMDALMAAEQARQEELARLEQQKIALITQAGAEFSRGKYRAAVEAAERVLDRDPDHVVARDIIEQSHEALRRRAWQAVYRQDKQNRKAENLKLRAKIIWPGAMIQYPAQEVWQEILDRSAVSLVPSAAAKRSDQELNHEAALDEVIEGFSFEETPLGEVINFFKMLPQFEKINFVVDETALGDAEIFVTRTMNNVTLRQALKAMLIPKDLNFVVANDAIFISNEEGCRRAEASEDKLFFYQYDVSDLLIRVEEAAADNATTDNDTTTTNTTTTTTTSDDNNNDGGTGMDAEEDLIELIKLFTGGDTSWDVIGAVGGGGGGGNNNEDEEGGGGGGLADLMAAGEEARRIAILRQGYLMVQHVDRIHKIIQELLARLRAQITIQVLIEARYITYTDKFYKDIGVEWSNLSYNFSSKLGGLIPGSTWEISGINPIAHSPSWGLERDIFQANVSFMNSAQTKAVIKAVKNSSHATDVTAPHVTVMNTHEQELTIKAEDSYISGYSVVDGFAIPNISPYTVSDTSLTVRPVVSADRRYVTMRVEIDNSSGTLSLPTPVVIPIRTAGNNNAGGNTTVYIYTVKTDTNSIDSTVRVPDRGTLVLGGLSNVAETTGEGSVPLLCHVPILKRLFVRSAVGKQRIHNMFLVTPTILLQNEVEP